VLEMIAVAMVDPGGGKRTDQKLKRRLVAE